MSVFDRGRDHYLDFRFREKNLAREWATAAVRGMESVAHDTCIALPPGMYVTADLPFPVSADEAFKVGRQLRLEGGRYAPEIPDGAAYASSCEGRLCGVLAVCEYRGGVPSAYLVAKS